MVLQRAHLKVLLAGFGVQSCGVSSFLYVPGPLRGSCKGTIRVQGSGYNRVALARFFVCLIGAAESANVISTRRRGSPHASHFRVLRFGSTVRLTFG